jgi:hypothetical protein
MGGFFVSETFWLHATNGALGVATLACCVVIGWCIVKDFRQRARQKKQELRVPKDYLAGLKRLGIAVGGRRKKADESRTG